MLILWISIIYLLTSTILLLGATTPDPPSTKWRIACGLVGGVGFFIALTIALFLTLFQNVN